MATRDQTERIQAKLQAARRADPDLRVFGANLHEYVVHEPVATKAVTDFEREFGVSLPECYRAFITQVGNGGVSSGGSAAGPFYGIYPLGTNLEELTDNPRITLRSAPIITPDMTDDAWEMLTGEIDDRAGSDPEVEAKAARLFGGILPIGSQGCTYLHGLVLSGEHRGRVVNLDTERQKPSFAFERNFLDWYERWLDEVISGELLVEGPTWFGYTMGGTDLELAKQFQHSADDASRVHCLEGLLCKIKLSAEVLDVVEHACACKTAEISNLAIQLLVKHDYPRGRPFLLSRICTDPLFVLQAVLWYARHHAEDWAEHIKALLTNQQVDTELFRFATYVAKHCRTDLTSVIAPFATHKNEALRTQAKYSLDQLRDKIT